MLQRLKIENYTVMPSVEVHFAPGLNVITGETGVGKSLLLDAVGFLLGERRTNFPIRSGSHRALIEAEFDADQAEAIRRWLQERDFSPDLPVILRREFLPNNRTRIFINDSPATLQQARALGEILLDLHGQHEVVALFDRARQLEFLDEYSHQPGVLSKYQALFRQLRTQREQLESLQARIADSSSGRQVLEVQKREIAELNPKPGEIETLEAELKRLENAEHIHQLCAEICDRLNEAPSSAVENVSAALKKLPDLLPFDPGLQSWYQELETTRALLLEANRTLLDFGRSVKHNPQHVEELRQRLMALIGMRKRWHYGDQDICEAAADIERFLSVMDELEQQAENLANQIAPSKMALLSSGEKLATVRQKAAKSLEKQVQKRLSNIGMAKAHFQVQFAPLELEKPYPDGLDRIEFALSPDGKIPHQSLRLVASGGEMSRILLALKGSLAAVDHVETLIFDEIDQGISGRVARMVGAQLLELSRTHQVIVVTHLPQIASLGDVHLSVRAEGKDGSATVHALDEEERAQELASLLAAAGVSEGALLNAREMLESARAMR